MSHILYSARLAGVNFVISNIASSTSYQGAICQRWLEPSPRTWGGSECDLKTAQKLLGERLRLMRGFIGPIRVEPGAEMESFR